MVRISSSIRRQCQELDGSVGVLVKTELSADEALSLVEQLVSELQERAAVDPVLEQPQFTAQRTAKGPGIWITDLVDVAPVLSRIADLLVARGQSEARLTTMPLVRPLHGYGDVLETVRAFIALRGNATGEWNAPVGFPGRRRHWVVDDADTWAALDYLSDWVTEVPGARGNAAISVGPVFTAVPVDAVKSMLRASWQSADRHFGLSVIVSAGRVFRGLDAKPGFGIAGVYEGNRIGERLDWAAAVTAVSEVLRGAGPWCTYAHVTRDGRFGVPMDAEHGWLGADVPWAGNWIDVRPIIADGLLYDAFGVMRLPTTIAAYCDLHQWETSTTATRDSVLVSQGDLAAWFAHPRIDRDVLRSARAALAANIAPRGPGPERDLWAIATGTESRQLYPGTDRLLPPPAPNRKWWVQFWPDAATRTPFRTAEGHPISLEDLPLPADLLARLQRWANQPDRHIRDALVAEGEQLYTETRTHVMHLVTLQAQQHRPVPIWDLPMSRNRLRKPR